MFDMYFFLIKMESEARRRVVVAPVGLNEVRENADEPEFEGVYWKILHNSFIIYIYYILYKFKLEFFFCSNLRLSLI